MFRRYGAKMEIKPWELMPESEQRWEVNSIVKAHVLGTRVENI
jgi:hypothetical protein